MGGWCRDLLRASPGTDVSKKPELPLPKFCHHHTQQIKRNELQQAAHRCAADRGIRQAVRQEVKEGSEFKVVKQSLPTHPQPGKSIKSGQTHSCLRLLRAMLV